MITTAPSGGFFRRCPAIGLVIYILIEMEITRDQLTELRELIEDSVEYFCDNNTVSGQLAWTCVESLGTAKLAELNGLLVAE